MNKILGKALSFMTSKKLIKAKRNKKVVFSFSVVLSLALVLTMAYSSYRIFASSVDYAIINSVPYSRWYYEQGTEDNHGYIYYGSFPNSEVQRPDDATEDNEVDGQVFESTDGNKYLYELDVQNTPQGHWFKFEPIKWQILDIENTDGREKLILMTESCIESRRWDTVKKKQFWNGQGGAISGTQVSYPALRLYLNSYDSSIAYSGTGNSYSSLKYTTHEDARFEDKGFFEKAFTKDERAAILKDANENTVAANDGNTKVNDKVRLLANSEMVEANNNNGVGAKYGFAKANARWMESNRLGYTTEYSMARYSAAITALTDSFGNRRTAQNYWTMSMNVSTTETAVVFNPIYSSYQGALTSTLWSNYFGIRPVISLDLNSLVKNDGDGSFDDPYSFDIEANGFEVAGDFVPTGSADFVWDISKDGDRSILVYYFKDFNDGTLVFESTDPENEAIDFKYAVNGHATGTGNIFSYIIHDDTTAMPNSKLTGANWNSLLPQERGFVVTASTKSYNFTPWSLMQEMIPENKITNVIVNTPFKLTQGDVFFANLYDAEVIDASKLNTENVTSMNHMFDNCLQVRELDLSGYDTSNVTGMNSMFKNNELLNSLDLGSNFNTGNVTNMNSMFEGCGDLTSLPRVSYFDTTNVTGMASMFKGCSSLSTLNLGENFVTSKVTSFDSMFKDCSSLTSLDISMLNGSLVTSTADMFNGCSSLEELDVSSLTTTTKLTNISNMFRGCSSLEEINIINMNITKVTDASGLFAGCSSLERITPDSIASTTFKNVSEMYKDCKNLRRAGFVISGSSTVLTNLTSMFEGCTNLTAVDIRGTFSSSIKDATSMFKNCSSLTELDLSDFVAASVKTVNNMFAGCSNLKNLDLSGLTISANTANLCTGFFANCGSFEKIKLPQTSTPAATLNITLPQGAYREIYTVSNKGVKTAYTQNYIPKYAAASVGLELVPSVVFIDDDGCVYYDSDAYQYDSSDNDFGLSGTAKWNISDILADTDNLWAYVFAKKDPNDETIVDEDNLILAFYGDADKAKNLRYWYTSTSGGTIYLDRPGFSSPYETTSLDDPLYGLYLIPWSVYIDPSKITKGVVCKNVVCNYWDEWFYKLENLEEVDIQLSSNDVLKKPQSLGSTFQGSGITDLTDIWNKIDFSECTDAQHTFENTKITEIDTEGLDIDLTACASFSSMFKNCHELVSADLSGFRIDETLKNMNSMFEGSENLESVTFGPDFVSTGLTSLISTFEGCSSLSELDMGSSFDALSVTSIANIFEGTNLTTYDLSAWNLSSELKYVSDAFKDTVQTYSILDLSDNDMSGLGTQYLLGTSDHNNIKKIILPDKAGSDVRIPAPNNFAWFAYLGDSKVKPAQEFTTLPAKSASYDNLRLEPKQIRNTQYTLYYTDDALYEWDVSENGDGQVMAYYFNGHGTIANKDYDGELVIVSFDDDAKMMEFNNAMFVNGLGSIKQENGNTDITSSNFVNYIEANNKRGFVYTSSGDEVRTTPWSILNEFSADNKIHKVFVGNTTHDVKFASGSYAFEGLSDVVTINLGDADLSEAKDFKKMFRLNTNMTAATFPAECTTQARDMSDMFSCCYKLTTLNLERVTANNVTNMSSMFTSCRLLNDIDLSNFETSNVTNMESMFSNCEALTNLDLRNFDVSNVAKMDLMFSGCSSLVDLKITGWTTDSVTDLSSMFARCSSLDYVDVSNFVTSNVTTFGSMFSGCSSLVAVDLSNFDTMNSLDFSEMFKDCSTLTELDLSSFETKSTYKSFGNMFDGCSSLDTLNISGLTIGANDNVSLMLNGCSSLTWIDIPKTISNLQVNDVTLPGGKVYNLYSSNGTVKEANVTKLYSRTETPGASYIASGAETPIFTDSDGYKYYLSDVYTYSSSENILGSSGTASWDISSSSDGSVHAYVFHKKKSSTQGDIDSSNDLILVFDGAGTSVKNYNYIFIGQGDESGTTKLSTYTTDSNFIKEVTKTNSEITWNEVIPWSLYVNKENIKEAVMTESVAFTNWNGLFANLTNLSDIDIRLNGNAKKKPTTLVKTFNNCGITNYSSVLNKINFENVTNMNGAFMNTKVTSFPWSALNSVDVSLESFDAVFYNSKLTSVDTRGLSLDFTGVKSMTYLFRDCADLTAIDLSGINTSDALTDLDGICEYDRILTSVIFGEGMTTTKLDTLIYAFSYCENLTTLDFGGLSSSQVGNDYAVGIDGAFQKTKLSYINLSALSPSGTTKFAGINVFQNLEGSNVEINLSGIDLQLCLNALFTNSDCITKITLPSKVPIVVKSLPTGTRYSLYDSNGEIIPGYETVTKLYAAGSVAGAAYIGKYYPKKIFTDKDGYDYYESEIYNYTASDNCLSESGIAKWDISAGGDESIYAYVFKKKKSSDEGDFDESGDLVLAIAGSGANAKAYEHFFDKVNKGNPVYTVLSSFNSPKDTDTLVVVPWTLYVDKTKIKEAVVCENVNCDVWNGWFTSLSGLTDIDIKLASDGDGGFVKKTPTKMIGTFAKLNITNFDDVFEKLDTSNVTDVTNLFYGSKIETFDWTKTNWTNLDKAWGMFQNSSIKYVDLSSTVVDFKKNAYTTYMFAGALDLEYVDLSGLETSNALKNAAEMFSGCKSLTSISFGNESLSKFTLTKSASMYNMFKQTAANEYDLTYMVGDGYKPSDVHNMFDGLLGDDITINLSNFDFSDVTNSSYYKDIFINSNGITKIILPKGVPSGDITLPQGVEYAIYNHDGKKIKSLGTNGIVTKLYANNAEGSGAEYIGIKTDDDPIYTDEDGNDIFENDALYSWDISYEENQGIMAYYFNGNKNKNGEDTSRTYNGELVIVQDNPNDKLVHFGGASNEDGFINGSLEDVDYIFDDPETYLSELRGYKQEETFSPWALMNNYTDNKVTKVILANEIVCDDHSPEFFFAGLGDLTSIVNLGNLDTSNAEWFGSMFYGCSSITELEVEDFETSKVIDFSQMFAWCDSLESVDISGFDFSVADTLSSMFAGCRSLPSLDLSSLSTCDDGTLTILYRMFDGCSSLDGIEFPDGFNTSNVEDFEGMFAYCDSLTEIDLSMFDVSNSTTMRSMFDNDFSLTKINLNWTDNPQGWRDMGYMFSNNESLTELNLSNLNTTTAYSMEGLFTGCLALETITFGDDFVTDEVTNMKKMFMGCSALSELDLSNFTIVNSCNTDDFFKNCNSLIKITLPSLGDLKNNITLPELDNGWGVYDSSDNMISSFGKVEALVSKDVNGASYIAQYVPTLIFTDEDGIDYFDDDVEEYSYDYGTGSNQITDSGKTVWDISSSSSEQKIYAYVFHKKKSSTIGDKDDSDDYILVFTGSGNAKAFKNVFDKYDASTAKFYVYRPGSSSAASFNTNQLTSFTQSDIKDTTPWSIAGFNTQIKKAVVTEDVKSNCWDLWFMNLKNVTDIDIRLHDDEKKAPKTMLGTFAYLSQLGTDKTISSSAIIDKFSFENATNLKGMFALSFISSFPWTKFNEATNLTNVSYMFNQTSFKTIDLTGLTVNMSSVTNAASLFDNCLSLQSVNLSGLVTSDTKLKDINKMFNSNSSLTTLILGDDFKTSAATDMSSFIYGCSSLTTFTPGAGFDMSGATNLRYAFARTKLSSYDLTSWVSKDAGGNPKTITPTNAAYLLEFIKGENVTINLSNLDLSSVGSNMTDIFDRSEGIAKIILPKALPASDIELPAGKEYAIYNADDEVITSLGTDGKVTKLYAAGDNGASYIAPPRPITTIDGIEYYAGDAFSYDVTFGAYNFTGQTKWDISDDGDGSLFAYVFKKKKSNATGDVEPNSTDLYLVFDGKGTNAKKFTKIFLDATSYLVTYNTTDGIGKTNNNSTWNAASFDEIIPWTYCVDSSKITKAVVTENVNCDIWDGWFMNLNKLSSLRIDLKENTKKTPISLAGTFCNSNLQDASSIFDVIDTSNTTVMSATFGSYKGQTFPWNELNVSNVTNAHAMFAGSIFKTIDTTGVTVDFSNATDMSAIFKDCTLCTNCNLSGFKTSSNLTTLQEAFASNMKLTTLTLGDNFDTSGVTNMYMFAYNSQALQTLNVGAKFDLSNVTLMIQIFDSTKLSNFDFPNWVSKDGGAPKTITASSTASAFKGLLAQNVRVNLSNVDLSTSTYSDNMFLNSNGITRIDLPVGVPASEIALPSGKEYAIYNEDGEVINSLGNDGVVTKLYAAGDHGASYIALSVPKLITTIDGIEYYDKDAFDYDKTYGSVNLTGKTKWDISASGDGSIFAYVFKKKKSNTVGDIDTSSSDLYLVYDGNGLNAHKYSNAIKNVNGTTISMHMFTDGPSSSSSGNASTYTTDTYKEYFIPWSYCTDYWNIKKAVVTENVQCDIWDGWFFNLYNLSDIRIDLKDNTKKVPTSLISTFNKTNVSSFDDILDSIDTSSCTNFTRTFEYFSGSSFPWSKVNTKEATLLSGMFAHSNITSVDLSSCEWDVSLASKLDGMFDTCTKLVNVDLSGLKNSGNALTNLRGMFYSCSKLGSVKFGTNFDTSNVTNMQIMFSGCSALTELDIRSFNINITSANEGMINPFISDCTSLNKVIMPESVPTDFDLLLPSSKTYYAMGTSGEVLTSLGTNGVITELYNSSDCFAAQTLDFTLVDSDFTFPESTSFTYDGNAHYIEGTINPDYSFLTCTTIYTKGSSSGEVIDKSNIKDAGTYYLKINVTSNVGDGSKTEWIKSFTITPKAINDLTFDPATIGPYEYTGSSIDASCDIHLKYGTTELVKGTDFTLVIKDSDGNTLGTNPSQVGSYTCELTGTGNYTGTNSISFAIVPKIYTITDDAFDAVLASKLEKVYDGTDSFQVDTTVNIEGTDVPVILTGTFDSKNAGDRTVTVTIAFKNSSDESLYTLSKTSITKSGKITKLDATYNLSVNPKVYDGTNNITPSDITAEITNKITGDDVSISVAGAYDDVNVNENIKVNFTLSLSGSDKDNYNLVNSSPSENIGKITERELEYEVTPNNKEYDGTRDATASVRITSGKVNDDDVSIEVDLASFEDASIGQNKPVSVTLKLTGNKKGNYKFTQPQGLTANISNKLVKVVFSTPTSKVYDGTKDATGLIEVVKVTDLNDVEITDGVKVKVKSATFDSKNVGTGKVIVVVPEFTEGAGSFDFNSSSYNVEGGEIAKKTLTFNVNVPDKTYDGTKSAAGTVIKNSIIGIVSGENPTITLTNGMFALKDASDEITATFDASVNDDNYYVEPQITAKGNIKKKDLHIDATTDDGDYNIGDPITVHFALRESDLVSGELVGISTSSGSGVVEESSNKKVKKVTIDTWPTLTGQASVTKNYNEVHSDCFVNLTRLDLSNERLEITIVTRDYFDGTPKEVNVSIRFPELGVTLREGTDFTFDYLDDHTDIGSHDIKITFIGEYKGDRTSSFEIKEKPQPAPSGGGGGGGGSAGGVTYTVLPKDEIVEMHKAFMKGYEDNTFRPQDAISREEVATIVARCDSEFNEDFNFTSHNTFPDVDTRWSKNYIGFCKLKDLIHGYEDGSFGPTRYMTRAELATLVNNFLRVQNASFDNVDLTKPAFKDIDGRWYEESVNKLAALGILNGYEDGTFRGDNYVTRIEVTIVMNKINKRTAFDEIPDEYVEKITKVFKDITPDRWFFKDVAESVIDHPADLY